MKRYKCKECGYIHIGEEAPSVCPVCGFDSEVFHEMEDVDKDKVYKYYDMIESKNDQVLNLLRKNIEEMKDLSGLAFAMYIQAEDKEKSDRAEYLKEVSFELLHGAAINTMFLGEDLEFTTEDNIILLKKKLDKLKSNSHELIELMKDDYLETEAEIIANSLINL